MRRDRPGAVRRLPRNPRRRLVRLGMSALLAMGGRAARGGVVLQAVGKEGVHPRLCLGASVVQANVGRSKRLGARRLHRRARRLGWPSACCMQRSLRVGVRLLRGLRERLSELHGRLRVLVLAKRFGGEGAITWVRGRARAKSEGEGEGATWARPLSG